MTNRLERQPAKDAIPNEDVHNWISVLREGGFDDREIDKILSHTNETYATLKGIRDPDRELQKFKDILHERGVVMSSEAEASIRQRIQLEIDSDNKKRAN